MLEYCCRAQHPKFDVTLRAEVLLVLRTAAEFILTSTAVRSTSSFGPWPQGKIPFSVTRADFSDSL
jgi:hypothetical protein